VNDSSLRMPALALATAVTLVAGVTVVQGMLTERWAPASREELEQASRLLEARFPDQFGEWEAEQELESDPKELERAGAVGHISRLYRNTRSKARVSAFVVSALPHDASGHTPDRCYPGAGFTVGESEHRLTIPLADGRKAEVFTGTFVKSGQTLRIFWTYGIPTGRAGGGLEWIAPQIARIALNRQPAVYKLYAIADETRIGRSQSTVECEQFIAQLMPALDTALYGVAPPAGEPAAAGPAADTPAATDAAAAD
jgi:hypothetical protein